LDAVPAIPTGLSRVVPETAQKRPFLSTKVLKLTFVEELFQQNKKLLSIPHFAWGYEESDGRSRQQLGALLDALRSTLPIRFEPTSRLSSKRRRFSE
jgi:hypothetical protein